MVTVEGQFVWHVIIDKYKTVEGNHQIIAENLFVAFCKQWILTRNPTQK